MNNFFSQQDDDGEFKDIPDEVNNQEAPIPRIASPKLPTPPVAPSAPVQYEELEQELEEPQQEETTEDEDFSAVLNEARFKLELGRLYEMIMNHDIFQGSDADAKASKYVTKQIRNFAKEQMEIMLGMRQKPEVQAAVVSSPFNDIEVQTLKALVYTATKGASATPEAQSFTPAPVAPKVGLNSIGLKPKTNAVVPVQKAAAKPLPAKAQSPVARDRKIDTKIEQILREEGISREEYERQYNPSFKPLNKPLGEMTEAEILEWKRQDALKTNRQVKNPQALPMPTAEQEEMLYTQRANAAANNPQMQSIMNLLTSSKPNNN